MNETTTSILGESDVAIAGILIDRPMSVSVVQLPERFDVFAEVDFRFDEIRAGMTVVLDGSNVRFADLHALQSVADARLEALDRDCDLVFATPSDELRATLDLTGFGHLINTIVGGSR